MELLPFLDLLSTLVFALVGARIAADKKKKKKMVISFSSYYSISFEEITMIRLSLILIILLKLQLSCSFSKTSKFIHRPFKLKIVGDSIISSQDSYALLAAMTGSAALGLKLEKDTSFGKSLSAPVCAMIITAIMTNTGLYTNGLMGQFILYTLHY